MTKRENFLAIRELVVDHQELVDFIDHEVELLDKKRTTPRKPTKTQLENVAFAEDIMRTFEEVDGLITMRELQEVCKPLAGLTTQRITHILTGLIKKGKAKREIIKKVRYYGLA